MTTANKVTICRILLVPFFVVAVIYYAKTGVEFYRWFAISCFAVAAISDGVDGFIARHFNQWSELGTVLDPLADKLLLVSAIILLSLHNEPFLVTAFFDRVNKIARPFLARNRFFRFIDKGAYVGQIGLEHGATGFTFVGF